LSHARGPKADTKLKATSKPENGNYHHFTPISGQASARFAVGYVPKTRKTHLDSENCNSECLTCTRSLINANPVFAFVKTAELRRRGAIALRLGTLISIFGVAIAEFGIGFLGLQTTYLQYAWLMLLPGVILIVIGIIFQWKAREEEQLQQR
jgi:hypothetical protein